jgi:gamma-glutamyl-gamma-aminobutyraldehyde dehydrogenase
MTTSAVLPDTIRVQAFIDGEFVDACDHATFDSLAPATGRVIAQIAAGGEADIDLAVRAARAAFSRGDWSRIAPAAQVRRPDRGARR